MELRGGEGETVRRGDGRRETEEGRPENRAWSEVHGALRGGPACPPSGKEI
jgi:hypothetical protein